MKIITYSDLHLEFGGGFSLPKDIDADLMILAGDIITLKDFEPLKVFLSNWNKPVLYIMGNHEYYTRTPMDKCLKEFSSWLSKNLPNVKILNNEELVLNDARFFGGTMWTWFNGCQIYAMKNAKQALSDYKEIRISDSKKRITPKYTTDLHDVFKKRLIKWLEQNNGQTRVVITHHAPIESPDTEYTHSPVKHAFVSTDMKRIIEKYQPDFWIYGHTHENWSGMIGKTKVISNQLGYPTNIKGQFECDGFDEYGNMFEV